MRAALALLILLLPLAFPAALAEAGALARVDEGVVGLCVEECRASDGRRCQVRVTVLGTAACSDGPGAADLLA